MVAWPHDSARREIGSEARHLAAEVAAQVEQIVTDVIELADAQALDILPSRTVVQDVLDTLDESQAG
jgi:hypothetical protein